MIASYRGQGVGKALMHVTLARAKAIGLTRVQLSVREPNKIALALYRKEGFFIEGIRRKAVRVGELYEDLISMGLLFE